MQYGYGRVSTLVQDTALQEDAFRRAGVQQMVLEKQSGASTRPRLRALLARLSAGDVVTVYKLDRMGRSLQDLLAILDQINAAGASFRSLTEPIDTATPAGKLMYSILGAVAEFERSLIRERSVAGQIAAVRRGAKLGRKRKLSEAQELQVIDALALKRESQRGLARKLGVSADVVAMTWHRFANPEHPRVCRKHGVIARALASGK